MVARSDFSRLVASHPSIPGKPEIHQDEIRLRLARDSDAFEAVDGDGDAIAAQLQTP